MPPLIAPGLPTNPAERSRGKLAWCCVGFAIVCLFLAHAWRTEADADLWGHLRFGLETLSTRTLTETDPYSYTAAGAAWTNHEWLSELTFAACYSMAGAAGLILLRGALLALTFAAVGIIVARRRLSPAATLALALFGVTFLPEFYRVRPQMFTYTVFAWLIVICDGYQTGRRWPLAGLPILFGLWCNFHAGFVAGLGVLGIYWCSFIWDSLRVPNRGAERRWLGLVLIACVAATLCNPYGIEYWRYVLYAVTLPRPAITEWGPVWSHHPIVVACYLTAVLVPAACWLASPRRGAVAETVAFLLVAYLSARHARHIPFAIILGSAVFSRRWAELEKRMRVGRERSLNEISSGHDINRSLPLAKLSFGSLVLIALLGGMTKLTREVAAAQREGVLTVPSGLYPVAAVSFLEDRKITGNLYCGFSWGEYCLWHLAPRCPVFCDGRYETVYPPEISGLALSPLTTVEERCAVVERYPTEILLVPTDSEFASWLATRRDFAEVYRDNLARVFLKRTAKFADVLSTLSGRTPVTRVSAPWVPFPG